MKGFRYFLVVLVAIAGLSFAAKLVYSRNPALAKSVVEVETPAAVETKSAPVDPSRAAPPVERTSAVSAPSGAEVRRAPGTQSSGPASPVKRRATVARPTPPNANPAPSPAAPAAFTTEPPATASVPPPEAQPPAPAWQATPRQLVRDSAYVMTSSGRLQAAIAVLDGWVREHPADTAIALDLARLRARAGDWQGSIAQYTALIEQHRTAQLLFERGQTYLWSGDSRRGEADLLASESMSPRAETQRQLGDHYRWQGDFARAGRWYRLAARTAPGDTSLAQSILLLDRALDARLLMPGELSGGDL